MLILDPVRMVRPFKYISYKNYLNVLQILKNNSWISNLYHFCLYTYNTS